MPTPRPRRAVPRAVPRAAGFFENKPQMPHGGDKRAVQMAHGTGKKKTSCFLSFGAYLHSSKS